MRVYNTLTQSKVEFIPREEGKVSIYVCGPTVYNYIHIGNARCYLSFDVIKRYLKFKGFDVYHVQNFTDVDDKIINQAKKEGIPASEVAEKYSQGFIEDSKALKFDPPDIRPKATEHIPEMIEMIQGLVDKGFAYVEDGDVYFEVGKFDEYGKLSHRKLDEMEAGARVEVDERKRNPFDFALWKKAKEGEPSWSSPWGDGRPGWHIECSAMSLKYLGRSFDIHGGGQDLIFPHHENELAQAECYTAESPFVRYWLHNGFVTLTGDKMAKSVGNVVLLKDVIKKYDPMVVRMLFLTTHYRSPIDFSEEKLKESTRSYERLNNLVGNIDRVLKKREEKVSRLEPGRDVIVLKAFIENGEPEFVEAMDDDFNAPDALGGLFKAARDINTYLASYDEFSLDELDMLQDIKELFIRLGGAVGLEFTSFLSPEDVDEEWREERRAVMLSGLAKFAGVNVKDAGVLFNRDFPGFVKKFVDLRAAKRAEKEWQTADTIRAFLDSQDILLEDTAAGTLVRIRRLIV